MTNDGIMNHFYPGQLIYTATPLSGLIGAAYRLRPYQLVAGPAWISADKWDIEGKTTGPSNMAQELQMLQGLLEERFQLKYHRETRDLTQYKLLVAKGGPKLREAQGGDPKTDPGGTRVNRGLIQGHRDGILDLVNFLQSELGRPVVDNSGLTGRYDFKLEWVPDESQPNSQGVAPPADAAGPSIFAAIQEQLGLKLEAVKAPTEVFVIDHVEKPNEN